MANCLKLFRWSPTGNLRAPRRATAAFLRRREVGISEGVFIVATAAVNVKRTHPPALVTG
jgi:hypothetical protein